MYAIVKLVAVPFPVTSLMICSALFSLEHRQSVVMPFFL